MLDIIKKLVEPAAPPVAKSVATIAALEARVSEATARVEETRAAVVAASLAAVEASGDSEAAEALTKAKQARSDALVELDDANDALQGARARHTKSLDVEAAARKAEHDRLVRDLAAKRIVAGERLHAQAIRFGMAHERYLQATAAFVDALAPSGTAQRQLSMITSDAVARRVQLDLLTLGVKWAYKIPISVSAVKPFIETITEETDFLTSDACR